MKPLAALGALGFARESEKDVAEEDRVVELFRNRAELKKSYAAIQDEVHRLKDRLKQQEGATARVQEMLESLEARLGDPETAWPSLVFYQLRSLWTLGREQITQFVAELARQQEERERKLHFAECNRRQFAQRQALEARLREAEADAAEAGGRIADAQRRLSGYTRFWHHFKRRDLEARLEAMRSSASVANDALEAARAEHDALSAAQTAEFPGLSIDTRRAINVAAIAYAELLCLRLSKSNLVVLAKDAAARRESIDEYGSREECEALMVDIARAKIVLQNRANLSQEVRARTERLRQIAKYRSTGDTLPTAESIGFAEGDVLGQPAQGANAARLPNVLSEDCWDLFRIVLR